MILACPLAPTPGMPNLFCAMPLRRSAQIAIVLGFLAVGLWLVGAKRQEASRKPAQVAPKSASSIKLRSAAEIMQEPNKPSKYSEVTIRHLLYETHIYLKDDFSRAEVEAFLERHGRTTGNLLAASRLLHDLGFVREAVKADPGSRAAQLDLALRGESATERAGAIDAFRALEPDNALGDYLAAHHAFESGDAGAAAVALVKSLDSPVYDNWKAEVRAGMEFAYRDAGYEPLEAKYIGQFSAPSAELSRTLDVTDRLMELHGEFIRSADFDAADPTLMLALSVCRRLQDQPPYETLYGIILERRVLQQVDPSLAIGPGGESAAARLDELLAKEKEVKAILGVHIKMGSVDTATQSQFMDMSKAEGELAALKWLSEQK